MKPQFTRAELRLMNSMCGIASASIWGEGDYCDREWKTAVAIKTFDSLRSKIFGLLKDSEVTPEPREFEAKGAR